MRMAEGVEHIGRALEPADCRNVVGQRRPRAHPAIWLLRELHAKLADAPLHQPPFARIRGRIGRAELDAAGRAKTIAETREH